jgi:hypothetical protein
MIIQELMLITSSILPHYKEKLLDRAESILKRLEDIKQALKVKDDDVEALLGSDELEVLKLVKKSSSIKEAEAAAASQNSFVPLKEETGPSDD